MTRERSSIKISGGTFNGSTQIGIGHNEQYGAATDSGVTVAELRSLLQGQAEQIIAMAASEQARAAVRHELEQIEGQLDADEPNDTAVRMRWQSVLSLLDSALKASTKISEITDLIRQLFGG